MPSIAVVDDDPVVTMLIRLALEADGHEATAFSSAEALLEALPRTSFDLIVLDLHMGGMSGIDCLHRLQEQDLAPAARVIVLTGSEDDADIVRAHRSGAIGFLAKPFDPAKLIERLGAALSTPSMVWMDDLHQVVARSGLESA